LNPDTLAIDEEYSDEGFELGAKLLDITALQAELSSTSNLVQPLKQAIETASNILDERYKANLSITEIVSGRAWAIDQILKLAWQAQPWPDEKDISLVAVGGYGRGELLPHSDIDLLILTRKNNVSCYKSCISSFCALLWDIGLEIGQSVRSIKQCKSEAVNDITVATALMESRTIYGPAELHSEMYALTTGKRVWPIKKFLRAKWDEQNARHEKYHDIDYALEPNVKTSPGGLRDIQTIAWVAKRHFGASSFQDLVDAGFLKESEMTMLHKGQQFLWKLRYGLHFIEGRREDRLLFDKQRELAKLFGYKDDDKSLGVEKLMKQYYRAVANMRALNDVLLQHFDEAILREGERVKIEKINNRFQIRNDYIEAISPNVFKLYPSALIEIFVLMAQNPNIQAIRASTVRLLRDNRRLIDEEYRHDIRNVTLFMELIRAPHKMTLQIRRMARYGILGRYLPEFEQITGQMQHDLFHIYTVDAHTLQVVENMRRFRLPDADKKYPIAAHIHKNLPKVELLYIAGLYHDIAKGRGGDHSALGMKDAEDFCFRHRLSAWDTKLVVWLVSKHLFMSMTAQRRDINDPEVIHEFATLMGDKLHLDYLYAMTVADIRATNPELWNSWRASLMKQLYLNTKRALRLGLENPRNREERINDKKETSLYKLAEHGMDEERIHQIWGNANNEYFLRESAANIVWHTEAIASFSESGSLVVTDCLIQNALEGATQIFIYTKNSNYLFAKTAAAFEKLDLNIQGARIFTSDNDYCMDTYTVLEASGKPVGDNPKRLAEIEKVVTKYLNSDMETISPSHIRRTRKDKYFSHTIDINWLNSPNRDYSTVEINCPDQSGILASIGKTFAEHQINLRDARITTLGERVEDLFFVTDESNKPIGDQDLIDKIISQLKIDLEQRLDT
jgi:[protein-PII] uridylyltransferase